MVLGAKGGADQEVVRFDATEEHVANDSLSLCKFPGLQLSTMEAPVGVKLILQ